MRQILLASLLFTLAACDDDSSLADDAGGEVMDLNPSACLCERASEKRCAGNVIEICTQGRWSEESHCTSPTTCFAAQCFTPTTECPTSIRYHGYVEIAARMAPVQLDECITGGEIGRIVPLQDSNPDSQQRSIILAFPSGCPEPNLAFDTAFGFDVDSVVVSQAPMLSLDIPPGHEGAFFRQTTRLRRVGLLMAGDQVAGTAIITDYEFTYDAATSERCPTKSALPPALPLQNSCAWHEYSCAPCES